MPEEIRGALAPTYHRLLSRLVNQPLLVTPDHAQVLWSVVAPRAGLPVEALVDVFGKPLTSARDDGEAAVRSGPGEKARGDELAVKDGVAIIPVVGTLVPKLSSLHPYCGMTGYNGLRVLLERAADARDVQAVALDIDSPGGELHSQLHELVAAIQAVRAAKPVWAVCSDTAYSAAYWIASACDRVILPSVGGVGSVGVVRLHQDLSGALEQAGVVVTLIHAGAHKVDGHPYAALPETVRQAAQADLEAVRLSFATAVAEGRGIDVAAVLGTEARSLGAEEAVALRFADEIMSPSEALRALADTARVGPAYPVVAKGEQRMTTKNPASPVPGSGGQAQADAGGAAPIGHTESAAPPQVKTGSAEAGVSADAVTAAQRAERTRWAEALSGDGVGGQLDLAVHLLSETDMSAAAVAASLRLAGSGGADKAGGQSAFERAMEAYAGPHVPPSGDGDQGHADRTAGLLAAMQR